MLDNIFRKIGLILVKLYQLTLSPWLGGGCRFTPSCSNYALEAYFKHSALRASELVVYRLCRCHPLGGHGFDPVPAATQHQRFAHE